MGSRVTGLRLAMKGYEADSGYDLNNAVYLTSMFPGRVGPMPRSKILCNFSAVNKGQVPSTTGRQMATNMTEASTFATTVAIA
jgi:hypothetical protein